MGLADFPTRGGGGRIRIDCDMAIGMTEDLSRSGSGRARIYIRDCPIPIQLKESWDTVYARIGGNLSVGRRWAIFPTIDNSRALFDADLVIGISEDGQQDGNGRARIYVQGVYPVPIALDEIAATAYDRIVTARSSPLGTVTG